MISKSQRDIITNKVLKKFSELYLDRNANNLIKHYKKDNTLVTELDLFISDLVKKELFGKNNKQ